MNTAAFHVLTKPIGPICNLDCKYCFYLEKEALYPDASKWAMPDDVLESYIRQYIEQQDAPVISFAWQGGEPTLLDLDYFRHVVALQQTYANGKRIENAFQTNGVLLNDDWAGFFRDNSFLIGISIDGPRQLHDAFRVDKGGQPTFQRVLRAVELLRRHGVDFNTLTTVHRANSHAPLEVYRFLKEIGSHHMQFIPIVERIPAIPAEDGLVLLAPDCRQEGTLAPWAVEPQAYGEFLCAIFDEWVRRDVAQRYVQLFEVTLQMWAGMESSLCIFRRQCGSALALEHCGDVYSCDHFVYPQNRLGNIMEAPLATLLSSSQQQLFGQAKESTLPAYCRQCDVRFACNGECPKHRFATTPDGEPGLNYLCAAYKRFFHHVSPYMDFMVEQLRHQRPPALVMQWVHRQDLQATNRSAPSRNEACPCGSGRKFKKCCGTP